MYRLAVCVEELPAAGWQAYLAEPAETATLRGSKRRAKTDRTDAQLLRELVEQHRPPQAWIPPAHLLELRVLVRLPKTLVDDRTAWQQRLHAVLFHYGLVTTVPGAVIWARPAAGERLYAHVRNGDAHECHSLHVHMACGTASTPAGPGRVA